MLAGGNSIGASGGQSVRARLFCGGVPRDSALVSLEPNGDFRIGSALPDAAEPCADPVLLIVSAGGSWFAAGISKY